MSNKTTPPLRGTPLGVAGETTTPPLRGTPPQEGNKWQWQGKPDSQFPSVGGVSRSDGVVPKLRFPEFRGAGVWSKGAIGDLFDLGKKSEKASEFNSAKILTVKLHTNGVVKNERTNTFTGGTNYFRRCANEFIFSKIDLLSGAFGLVPEELDKFYSSSDVPTFAFKKSCNPFFFLNWLKATYLRLQIERTGTSKTLKRVAPNQFLAVPIWLPSKPEQQKIADCLSSLDDLISAQTQKLAALKTHKKGLMCSGLIAMDTLIGEKSTYIRR